MEHIQADHWLKVDMKVWPWANFTPKEVASKGNGAVYIEIEAMNKLQALRDIVGKPLIINSAYRDPAYNRKVGGANRSQHLEGRAFDIALRGHDPHALLAAAKAVGFRAFGKYRTFLHVDNRERPAAWAARDNGTRFVWSK